MKLFSPKMCIGYLSLLAIYCFIIQLTPPSTSIQYSVVMSSYGIAALVFMVYLFNNYEKWRNKQKKPKIEKRTVACIGLKYSRGYKEYLDYIQSVRSSKDQIMLSTDYVVLGMDLYLKLLRKCYGFANIDHLKTGEPFTVED